MRDCDATGVFSFLCKFNYVAKRPAKCGIATASISRQLPSEMLQKGLLNAGLRPLSFSYFSGSFTFLVAKRPAKCGIATMALLGLPFRCLPLQKGLLNAGLRRSTRMTDSYGF